MKRRKGEIATILTIATLVVIGVTAIASSFNLNKKQTTSSRAAEACAKVSCGNLSTNPSATYYQKYDTVEKMWKYYKNITTTCSAEAIEGVGKYCKSQNLAEGVECVEASCASPNASKKYHKWKDSTGGKDPTKKYSDMCQTEIPNLTTYCATTGGDNITPEPGKNPPNWGKNMGKGCGTGENGDQNYQYGACYQGRRCVQCQNVGVWYTYNCFETDSTCTSDQVYCPSGWPKTQCVNGEHKCCDNTNCLPGNKIGETPTTKKSDCLSSASQCNTANNEYCSAANNVCTAGDTLLETVCGVSNQHCCKKTISKTSCKTSGSPSTIPRDTFKHCVSYDYGESWGTAVCVDGEEEATESDCPGNSSQYTGLCTAVSGGNSYCEKTTGSTNTCTATGYGCIDKSSAGETNDAKCIAKSYDRVDTTYSCGDSTKVCCYKNPVVAKTACETGANYNCDAAGGVCRASGKVGNVTKSYYATATPVTYAKKDGANCITQTETEVKSWCECTTSPSVAAPAAISGCSQDVTGCREITLQNQSCYTETNTRVSCDGGRNFCCSKLVVVNVPPKVTVSFKNACKGGESLHLAAFAPAFSGVYYSFDETVAIPPGGQSSYIDITEHCKSWGILRVHSNYGGGYSGYIYATPGNIDCKTGGNVILEVSGVTCN